MPQARLIGAARGVFSPRVTTPSFSQAVTGVLARWGVAREKPGERRISLPPPAPRGTDAPPPSSVAKRAALAFAGPGCPFRLLYVAGPSGSGKTRFLRGILARLSRRKAGYWTGAQWLARFRAAQRRRQGATLHEDHLSLEVLIIDGVETLAGSPPAQRALAEILDAPAGPVAALAGRAAAGQLSLEDRLLDRLSAGFSVALGENRSAT